MSKKDKLVDKLLKEPKDFTFDEMKSLLSYFGYELKQGGTGSGVKFIKEGSNEVINFHKPYPNGILKRYILDQIIEKLRKDGLL
ncbi:MAG: type II toxin-antitoxin system HicA family toxin [Lachnoclostridium sp.]|nr:type II toxin-antitoxin system HicA family toxin [Lachnospira sp.]MCM1249250.1 type II toxin-antitoxin system HicA family toxin [Lachnoclostridium sp.]